MPELVLTPEILESHVGVLGKTGSGKSNLGKVVVEGLLDAAARVCVIDPTGTWYGLRLTRDRKPSPYEVVMFGGNHADIAIGRTHGAAVAEAIGTTSTSAVIDTRTMTVGERTEFFTAFAETLLQRNRGPLHLVIDESHLFAPQGRVNDPKSGAMVHAANNLVSLGRGVGLRIILISQRPAKLHKDSLTQVETLVAMRLIAPQDRRAIEDWIGEWADPKQGAELVASLPSLRTGEAWIWSPEAGVLERRQTPLASTLDTGKPSSEPIELASIDIAAMRERLDEVAAQVLANDPAELRRRIRELESLSSTPHAPTLVEKIVEVPVLNGQVGELRLAIGELVDAGQRLVEVAAAVGDAAAVIQATGSSITTAMDRVASTSRAVLEQKHAAPVRAGTSSFPPAREPLAAPPEVSPRSPGEPGQLGKAERAFLTTLARHPAGLSRIQLAILTGYSIKSSSIKNGLGALRSAGYVEKTGEPIRITAAGLEAAGDVPPAPTGAELREYWLAQLGAAERAFLEILVAAYPAAVTKEDLAERSGYSLTSSSIKNGLGRLRSLGLVDGWTANPEIVG